MQENDLRLQLRQLPKEIDPPRDLWSGIEGRLGERRVVAPARRPWLGLVALAACLCLAVGLAWMLRSPTTLPATDAPAIASTDAGAPAATDTAPRSLRAELVRREADALTKEYYAALREFEGAPMPEPLQPALATLDRSADDIRGALHTDPELFLLERLRRTYATRLSLTQRAVTG